MASIPFERVKAYRKDTFRLLPGQRLASAEEAVQFVNQRGFIFFWPIKDITLPNLWVAVAGDRPVADQHDDPGHVTWGWKDGLLGQRCWYYAKVLRKKATMISLERAPHFYALSHNYGAPDEDYLTLYEQGQLTQEAKTVYETLLHEGPLNTVALRKATRMSNRESDSRFNRALADLQADFKILPTGVAKAGAWNYAFIYEITSRHYPELPDFAHAISEREARQQLLADYFRSLGAAQPGEVQRLFGWGKASNEKAIESLVSSGQIIRDIQVAGQIGDWLALKELVEEENWS
ncbi:MAG: crosslink repair DNA glycosylase YcaQ family protein [Anaerolineales bacterium]|jgi:hypothetical protein